MIKDISKHINFLFVIITALFFDSCNKESKLNVNWERVDTLIGESVIFGNVLKDPWALGASDSTIIVGNYKSEPLIEIYDLYGNCLYKTLSLGKGPNEVLNIGSIQTTTEGDNIYICDLFQKKFMEIEKINKTNSVYYYPRTVLNFNDEDKIKYEIDKIIQYSKHSYFISGDFNEGRLVYYNSKDKKIEFYLNNNVKINDKLSCIENNHLFSSAISLSPDKKKIGMATYNADMIDLMAVVDDTLVSLFSNIEFLPNNIQIFELGQGAKAIFTNKSRKGYFDACAGNNFFYMIFSGKTWESASQSEKFFSNLIRRISWDGKICQEYILNRPIKRIAISPDEKTLYGISYSEGELPEIVKFNF